MLALPHMLGLNPAASARLVRVREIRTNHAGAPTAGARLGPGSASRCAVAERAQPYPYAASTLAARVEHALFAATLTLMGCLYLGALLANTL
jgi:hypothetical protein